MPGRQDSVLCQPTKITGPRILGQITVRVGSGDRSAGRLSLTRQDPSERSLAGSIASYQADLVASRHLERGVLQQETRTRAYLHIPRNQHRTHSSVRVLDDQDRVWALGRSQSNGERLGTTAVTSSVQGQFAIPNVSNFLRPSPFPVAPLSPSWTRSWSRPYRRGRRPMLVARDVRYLFRGRKWR